MTNSIPTFEEAGLRYEEDTPVVIPSLKRALQLLAREGPDPHSFRTLVFFFSFLHPSEPNDSTGEQVEDLRDDLVIRKWKHRKSMLAYLKTFWHRNEMILDQVDAVIDQLDAIATSREVARLMKINIRGNPYSHMNREHGWVGEYNMHTRVFDWVTRCAFELELPNVWKEWLQLMYQKQPSQIRDEDHQHGYRGIRAFRKSVKEAGRLRPDQVRHVISLTEFWVRQALTIVSVWDMRLASEAHLIDDGDDVMPPYSWCVAAYDKMNSNFFNFLVDPFSPYHYELRRSVLRKLDYRSVFEECWGLVREACPTTTANSYKFFQLRLDVYHAVVRKVRNVLRSKLPGNVIDDLNLAFEDTFERPNEHGKYRLLQELPEIEPYALQHELQEWRALYNGMCDQWYPLPFEEQEEEEEEEFDYGDFSGMEGVQFELLEDVEMEVYGPRIDITQFTVGKECDADAFCTWCQETISSTGSDAKRCVMPMACSDIFHAECLDEWVNGASQSSNRCPNCKVLMTPMQRTRRPILTDQ
jgi:hypothetical protein